MEANISLVRINGQHTNYNRDMIRRSRNLRRKQIQQFKQKLFILMISVLFIVILGFAFGSFMTNAKTKDSDLKKYKYFTSYTIKYHDTLWEIAPDFMDGHYETIQDYIDEVERMNHIDADQIKAGTTIMLPYYSDEYLE